MKTFSISIIALFFILFAAENARACKCAEPPTVEQSFEQSAGVFYGTVEEVNNFGSVVSAVFKVEKSWKGAEFEETVVTTSATSCGINFQVGEKHYLFVDKDAGAPNAFQTVTCRRHGGVQEEFLKNKPVLALKASRASNRLLMNAIAVTGFIVALAAIAIAGIYFFKSRKSDGLKEE